MLIISTAGTLIPISDHILSSPRKEGITVNGKMPVPKKELNNTPHNMVQIPPIANTPASLVSPVGFARVLSHIAPPPISIISP